MVAPNRKTEEFRVSPKSPRLSPEGYKNTYSGRQVFWLAQTFATFPSVFLSDSGKCAKAFIGLTATGIAPDFHRVPYYPKGTYLTAQM